MNIYWLLPEMLISISSGNFSPASLLWFLWPAFVKFMLFLSWMVRPDGWSLVIVMSPLLMAPYPFYGWAGASMVWKIFFIYYRLWGLGILALCYSLFSICLTLYDSIDLLLLFEDFRILAPLRPCDSSTDSILLVIILPFGGETDFILTPLRLPGVLFFDL